MGWREFLHLYQKYEGDLGLATARELEHASRGMNPKTARQIAEADYKRRERKSKNDNDKENQETRSGNRRFCDSLF